MIWRKNGRGFQMIKKKANFVTDEDVDTFKDTETVEEDDVPYEQMMVTFDEERISQEQTEAANDSTEAD